MYNASAIFFFFKKAALFALLDSVIPFYWDQFGSCGFYCWIFQPKHGIDHTQGFALRMGTKYTQGVIMIIFNGYLYVKLYNYVSELDRGVQTNSPNKSRIKKTIRKFIFYPGYIPYVLPVCP